MVTKQTRVFVIVTALAALAVLVVVWITVPAGSPVEFKAAVFFAFAAFIAHCLAYRLPRGGFGDITFIPLLSGVAVTPTIPLVIGAAAAVFLAEYLRRRESIRIVFNAAQFTLSVALAVIVYRASGGTPLADAGFNSFVPFVAAFAAFFLCNAVCFAGVVAVSSQERFVAVLVRAAGGASLVYDLVGMPIVLGFAYTYVRIGWVWSGVLLLPLAGLRQVYKTNRELQTVNEEMLQLMVAAIEARDPYTSGHSQRVAAYSRVVARAAGLGHRATERVYTAALLHDVGKIHEEFAPILRNPGRLTAEEVAVMKSHSEKGAALVGKVSQFEDLVPAVLSHHEAWNGSGYPAGLKAENIPLWARVIAIADTVDAMTTDRPYRAALTLADARSELQVHSGRQFDPALAAALVPDKFWEEIQALMSVGRPAIPSHDVAESVRHSAVPSAPVGV